ncbi:MAG: RHS repeat-associated core domain-containing protein [Calditrichia bacterium]|nr:RHS repeat-associated core domain-containing protein [Calditrichia bacterium]
MFKGASLLYWNIYGNDGVAGRLEVSIPQEEGAEGGGGEGAGGGEVGGTQKLFYLKDHLGSTRAVMNTNGAVVESYDYYPFGLKMPGRMYVSGAGITKNLFTGKELDGETGWYYFGARPYLAHLGRWPVVDPLADETPSKTPYHYASNNPVNRIDLSGMQDEEDEEKKVVSATQGAAIATGQASNQAANARDEYQKTVSELDKTDSAGRKEARKAATNGTAFT